MQAIDRSLSRMITGAFNAMMGLLSTPEYWRGLMKVNNLDFVLKWAELCIEMFGFVQICSILF